MTTEMTTDTLRAAITAALKRRDPEAGLWQAISNDRRATWAATVRRVELVVSAHGPAADLDALRALAAACGLRDDGSDPAEEVERLRVALDDAADRLGCADYDDVCAAVADALDDAEKREREHVDEANALRLERDRLRVDNVRLLNTIESLSAQLCDTDRGRSEAREEARRLRTDNGRLDDVAKGALDDLARARAELDATREAFRAHLFCDECEELATRCHAESASFGCDAHGIGDGWRDTTHAAAVRAAGGVR